MLTRLRAFLSGNVRVRPIFDEQTGAPGTLLPTIANAGTMTPWTSLYSLISLSVKPSGHHEISGLRV